MINSESRFEHGEMGGGLLSGEYDNSGALIREYVYLNGEPLAQVTKSGGTETVTYLHTDHLATPRYGTNAAGSMVWTWDSGAFGKETPTGTATVNLRFPGQYYDSETTLHYNWNRYYNPATGRYISSDPIGLSAGINLYAYVFANPMSIVDLMGLLSGDTYKSVLDAVKDAVLEAFAKPDIHKYEYGGGIFAFCGIGGNKFYTYSIKQLDTGGGELEFVGRVAAWHTHPGYQPGQRNFSFDWTFTGWLPGDLEFVRDTRIDLYLGLRPVPFWGFQGELWVLPANSDSIYDDKLVATMPLGTNTWSDR